jgi:hypothetical protein
MKKLFRLLSAVALLLVQMRSSPLAAAPPGPYFNGFENNTAGWFDGFDRAIIRQPSGYMNGVGGYANGFSSADGKWHARLTAITQCRYDCDGPFTRWGGYSSTFPAGGYFTQLDIYLDVNWAASHDDYRFDWISAINNNAGGFLRDFVFNVGTQLAGAPHFTIQTSTNSTRSGANPNFPCPSPNGPNTLSPSSPPNTCRPPTPITTSGWYTFRHTFRDQAGTLAVDFDIFAHGSNTPITHQTIYADPMSTVGGNRYGWFSNEEIPDLAIDNSLRTGLCHEGDGDGDVEDSDSHKRHATFHKNSCGDGSSDHVQTDDDASNEHFQSSSINSATFTYDDNAQAVTIVGTGIHNWLPVGFTMIAVDNGSLAPGIVTLVLTDGYSFTGNLINGTIAIQ